ncbi:MAG: SDR family oxidoreductase [Salinispira sp.]
MISIDLSGQTALITGGTKGIGLASAMQLAQAGAQTVLTYKWGSADMNEVKKGFTDLGAPEPLLLEADVSVDEDTDKLLTEVKKIASSVDIFISNVGYAATMRSLDNYKKRSLYKTFDYSTWPMIEYTRKIKKLFGAYPKRVLGISSDGPDHFYPGYDYVAASKSLLEFFGKYMAAHLFTEGSRVNVIRFGNVKTESFNAIFGEEFFDFLENEGLVGADSVLTPEECGKAVLSLCSGLLDAMNGQIINIDYGLPFMDNTMIRFLSWKEKQKNAQHSESETL